MDLTPRQAFAYLLLIVFFIVLPRLSFVTDTIYNVDEGAAAVYADVVLHGGVPHKDVSDVRPFVFYLMYAIIFLFAGGVNIAALHAVLLVFIVIEALLIYAVARRFHSRKAGVLAALFFAISSFNHYGWFMLTFHSEWPMIAFILAAVLSLFKGLRSGNVLFAVLSGAFFGLAAFTKQTALLILIGTIGFLVFNTHEKNKIKFLGYLCFGFTTVVLAVFSYFFVLGVFKEFWFNFWTWNVRISSLVPVPLKVERAYAYPFSRGSIFYHNAIFFIAALCYLLAPGLRRDAWTDVRTDDHRTGLFLAIWLVCAYAGASLSGQSFGYYYILVLPPLCAAAGIIFCRLTSRAGAHTFLVVFIFLSLVYPAINVYGASEKSKLDWTSFPWLVKPPMIYQYDRAEENSAFIRMVSYVKSATFHGDKILVWGNLPQVYLKTERMPASRYFSSMLLTGYKYLGDIGPGGGLISEPWGQFAEDLNKSQPKIIVDSSVGYWTEFSKDFFPERFEPMRKILDANYELDRLFHTNGNTLFKVYRRKREEGDPADTVLPGLQAHWKCEDDARDASPSKHRGALYGTNAVKGREGLGLEFDGKHDFISLENGFSTVGEGFTFACWAYPTAVKSWARFLELGNGTPEDNIFFAREGVTNDLAFVVCRGETQVGRVIAKDAITLNKWQHFAVTLSPQGLATIYKNGVPIQSGRSALPAPVIRRRNYIGRSAWWQDDYYAGRIDEVYLFDRELTGEEIKELTNI